MMGAESTRNMYSNLAVNNKYDCLNLHHIGYLMKEKWYSIVIPYPCIHANTECVKFQLVRLLQINY
jgi:hypothetical protein